ncbi:MAG: amidase, partial [Candidatus Dormibacteria bacterium]
VAVGMVAVAEGSDAGGSVRIPASCCGVVGYKPPLGRIPMHSTGNDFETIYHHGPLARSVDDCALMLDVMAGPDERDPLSLPDWIHVTTPVAADVSQLRAALSTDLGFFEVDPQITAATLAVGNGLRDLGATVDPVDLGWDREVVDSWVAYWGVLLATMYGDKVDAYGDTMDPALVRLIRQGESMDAISFKRIDLVRSRQWQQLRSILDAYEVLICPTLAVAVPPAEGVDDDSYGGTSAAGRFMGLEMACPFNLVSQCPVMSVPSGRTSDGLPTGVQVVGRRFDDRTVLRVAKAIEGVVAKGLA